MIVYLNDVPTWLIEKARSLPDPYAVQSLLMEHTSVECWDYLPPFIEDVVYGNQVAASWLRGQVIAPDFSLVELLMRSPRALLAPIGGAFTSRIVPKLDDWKSHVSWIGAPVCILSDADYRFEVPLHAVALGNIDTEAITNPAIALRRWIATRLAQVVIDWRSIHSIEQLIATHKNLPDIKEWSEDARRAVNGLIREFQVLGEPNQTIPGMRALDGWF